MSPSEILVRLYFTAHTFMFLMALVHLSWAGPDYVAAMPARPSGRNAGVEEQLSKAFPPLHCRPFPLVSRPSIILDSAGNILTWYLPGLLSNERQVNLVLSLHEIG